MDKARIYHDLSSYSNTLSPKLLSYRIRAENHLFISSQRVIIHQKNMRDRKLSCKKKLVHK